MAAVTFRPAMSKIVIAVDEDIDPENLDAVFWALGYRSQPHRDVQIIRGTDIGHAPRHDARWRRRRFVPALGCDIERDLSADFFTRSKNTWSAPASFGKGSSCRSSSPSRPGTATSLGDWNSELDEEARCSPSPAISGRPAKRSLASGNRPTEVAVNTSYYGQQKKK